MSAYIKGPWEVSSSGVTIFAPVPEAGESDALRWRRAIAHTAYEEPDIARLIAAAPDLLAACQEWVEIWQPSKKHHASWRKLTAAIAKATGGAP